MWKRIGSFNKRENHGNSEKQLCALCVQLQKENDELKEKLSSLKGMRKKKEYSIAPTLYTFYKNNVQLNRVARYYSSIK